MKFLKATGLVALLSALSVVLSVSAQGIIDTTSSWSGDLVSTWGVPPSYFSSFGQTFVMPNGESHLDSMLFYIQNTSGSIDYQAYVYAWDPAQITTSGAALFTSTVQTLSAAPSTQPVEINTGSVGLTSGNAYVAFLTALNSPMGVELVWNYVAMFMRMAMQCMALKVI